MTAYNRPGDRDQQQAADWASAYDGWAVEPREFSGHGRRLAFRAGWEAARAVAEAATRAALAAAREDCENEGWAEVDRLRAALAAARAEEAARWRARIEALADEMSGPPNPGPAYIYAANRLRAVLDTDR